MRRLLPFLGHTVPREVVALRVYVMLIAALGLIFVSAIANATPVSDPLPQSSELRSDRLTITQNRLAPEEEPAPPQAVSNTVPARLPLPAPRTEVLL